METLGTMVTLGIIMATPVTTVTLATMVTVMGTPVAEVTFLVVIVTMVTLMGTPVTMVTPVTTGSFVCIDIFFCFLYLSIMPHL